VKWKGKGVEGKRTKIRRQLSGEGEDETEMIQHTGWGLVRYESQSSAGQTRPEEGGAGEF